jgi:flagellar motor protein MotB
MSDVRTSLGNNANVIDHDTLIGTNHTILFKESFLFDQGKDEFKDSHSEELIRKIGGVLLKYVQDSTVFRIVVEGHTNSDAMKGDPYGNWRLSSMRAVRVVKILDDMGILNAFQNKKDGPSRLLSVAGYSQYDYVPNRNGREDKEASKRIQISLEYRYK